MSDILDSVIDILQIGIFSLVIDSLDFVIDILDLEMSQLNF